jgi:large subunit ribosomal protein L3
MANHGIIAQKIGMTRMVDDQGTMTPVTLLQVAKQKVTKVITPEREGYHAIQIGYWEKPEKRLRKPDISRLRKAGVEENFTRFNEFRLDAALPEAVVGAELKIDAFEGVKTIDCVGLTKGRGFQGAIKRWGSARGRMTHGSCYHRRTGSIGSNTSPARVFKNKKMPGHMGCEQITIQNLKVMVVDKEQNIIAVKGSVPGFRNGYVVIKPSVKA